MTKLSISFAIIAAFISFGAAAQSVHPRCAEYKGEAAQTCSLIQRGHDAMTPAEKAKADADYQSIVIRMIVSIYPELEGKLEAAGPVKTSSLLVNSTSIDEAMAAAAEDNRASIQRELTALEIARPDMAAYVQARRNSLDLPTSGVHYTK